MKSYLQSSNNNNNNNNNNNKSSTIPESSAECIPGQHTQRSAEGVTLSLVTVLLSGVLRFATFLPLTLLFQ